MQKRNRFTDTENTLVGTKGERKGEGQIRGWDEEIQIIV